MRVAHLKTPAGSMRRGHTIMLRKKMTATMMSVGLRMRAISSISASLSTADPSIAPAFFTCAGAHMCRVNALPLRS